VGGTTTGRSLAPRAAARFKTGLTADCTILDIQGNTDLDQIRPAFGGNIMAHINTPRHRPQFATVRYKIFSAPEKCANPTGKLTECSLDPDKLKSNIEVVEIRKKAKETSIEDAEIIIVAGRGVKKEEDMRFIHELAESLDAQVAGTRSLIETGWLDAKKQIGLSGRTVKPKLIITCGVSGAIQFVAGMNSSDCIIAVNSDKNAPIFKHAHIGIVGDIYEVLPKLNEKLQELAK
jgi:electron transfer flavoprotein alpha subunit